MTPVLIVKDPVVTVQESVAELKFAVVVGFNPADIVPVIVLLEELELVKVIVKDELLDIEKPDEDTVAPVLLSLTVNVVDGDVVTDAFVVVDGDNPANVAVKED